MFAFFKHVKNFVCNDESRPIFKGICYDGQRAIATNTHLMVVVNNMPFEKRIIHWKTGELIDGTFPDFDKVVPISCEFNTDFTDVKEFIGVLKTALSVHEYASITGVTLIAKSENLKLEACLTGTIADKTNEPICFNVKYLYDILNFFKDAGVKTMRFGFNGPLQAIKITTDKDVMAVLTPIRTTWGE